MPRIPLTRVDSGSWEQRPTATHIDVQRLYSYRRVLTYETLLLDAAARQHPTAAARLLLPYLFTGATFPRERILEHVLACVQEPVDEHVRFLMRLIVVVPKVLRGTCVLALARMGAQRDTLEEQRKQLHQYMTRYRLDDPLVLEAYASILVAVFEEHGRHDDGQEALGVLARLVDAGHPPLGLLLQLASANSLEWERVATAAVATSPLTPDRFRLQHHLGTASRQDALAVLHMDPRCLPALALQPPLDLLLDLTAVSDDPALWTTLLRTLTPSARIPPWWLGHVFARSVFDHDPCLVPAALDARIAVARLLSNNLVTRIRARCASCVYCSFTDSGTPRPVVRAPLLPPACPSGPADGEEPPAATQTVPSRPC